MGGLHDGEAVGRWSRRRFLQRGLMVSGGLAAGGMGRLLFEPSLMPWSGFLHPAMASAATPRVFDVSLPPYGAKGDGISDDRAAIQAAIDDAAEAGGGTVYLPGGQYLLADVQEQTGIRYFLLNYYSGISLVGAGRDRTLLKAAPGMPDGTRIISAASADGQRRVVAAQFKDFTIDGAASDQPDARLMVGLSNVWTEQITVERVRIQAIAGTEIEEGVGFDSFFSSNHQYIDCEAIQLGEKAGASGFSATQSTGISYQGCSASGSVHWMGLTAYQSQSIEYRDCRGFLNAQRGMNCENSQGIRYVDCRAGGKAIGNRGDGIYLFQSSNVQVVDCAATDNQSGIVNNGSSAIRVVRGDYSANTLAGMSFATAADWANSQLLQGPVIEGNGLAPIAVAGLPAT